MKSSFSNNLLILGVVGVVALFVAGLGMRRFLVVPPVAGRSVHPPAPIVKSTPVPFTEVATTFAPRMPYRRGVSVVGGRGGYNASHLMVAVPDQFHEIHYLPRSDPKAIAYLKEMELSQQQQEFDNTPSDVDVGGVALGRDALASQGKKIGVNPGR